MKFLIFDLAHREAAPVEYKGFFHGAHKVDPQNGLAEIDAVFEKKTHETKLKSITACKRLRGELENLDRHAPSIAEAWERTQRSVNSDEVMVVMPIVVMVMGITALATEIVMLAPSLDLLDITDPNLQLVGAAGLAALGSVLLHLAWETVEKPSSSKLWTVIWRIMGGLTCVALVLWGMLRGYQVAFAAQMNDNPLATFLSGHPVLASVFYCFITLGAPVVAAGALTYGSRHLRNWYQYRKAKRDFQENTRRITITKGQVEAEEDGLKHELGQIEHERREWRHAYLQQHERGMKNGAKQPPFWIVQVKATLSAMAALIVSWWAFAFSPFSFLLPAALYLAAFLHFRHQRIHPTPAEFYNLERVTFAEPTTDDEPDQLTLPAVSKTVLNHDGFLGKLTAKTKEK
jgi:hypothetical protein